MIGLQPGHIVIIILVALIFFAPSRLPLLVRGMKSMFSEFRKEVVKPADDTTKTPAAGRSDSTHSSGHSPPRRKASEP